MAMQHKQPSSCLLRTETIRRSRHRLRLLGLLFLVVAPSSSSCVLTCVRVPCASGGQRNTTAVSQNTTAALLDNATTSVTNDNYRKIDSDAHCCSAWTCDPNMMMKPSSGGGRRRNKTAGGGRRKAEGKLVLSACKDLCDSNTSCVAIAHTDGICYLQDISENEIPFCQNGQVQRHEIIQSSTANSKTGCAAACDAHANCTAFDFTVKSKADACRLVGDGGTPQLGNQPRATSLPPSSSRLSSPLLSSPLLSSPRLTRPPTDPPSSALFL